MRDKPSALDFIVDILKEPRDSQGHQVKLSDEQTARIKATDISTMPLQRHEKEIYRECTGRSVLPKKRFVEISWNINSRGGKTLLSAGIATYNALMLVSESEAKTGTLSIVAADKEGSDINLAYLKKWFSEDEILKNAVDAILKDAIRLKSGLLIKAFPRSRSAVAGVNAPAGAVLDELGNWALKGSSEQDKEIAAMVLRGMLGKEKQAQLFKVSSPWKAEGIMHSDFLESYAVDEDEYRIYWKSDVFTSRPDLNKDTLENLRRTDARQFNVLYGGGWLESADAWLPPETIRSCIVRGRKALTPNEGDKLICAVDASGGAKDSYTGTILKREGDKIIQVAMCGFKPHGKNKSTNIAKAIKGIARMCDQYGVTTAYCDNFMVGPNQLLFQQEHIRLKIADKAQSKRTELFNNLEWYFLENKIELLDIPELETELIGLIRKTNGAIDHQRMAHSDWAEALALGVSVLTVKKVYSTGAYPMLIDGGGGYINETAAGGDFLSETRNRRF